MCGDESPKKHISRDDCAENEKEKQLFFWGV
jgi:hypothetical protein